jgi:hypothetical protein
MLYRKTDYYYDPEILRLELEKYIPYFNQMDQLSIKFDPHKNLNELPHYQCIGRSPSDILDWNFTEICPIFKNSKFLNILSNLKESTKRIRLMRIKPRSCYSFHYDTYRRLHWALLTFPECHMSFQSSVNNEFTGFHIPADGFGYWTDTKIKHTAVNPTMEYRYHLVIDIIE